MIKNHSINILFAQDEGGVIISGIIIVTHGKGCVYLLGWNGDLGKKLKANNFLLWHAIRDAKNRGECFFDLGGVLLSNPKYKSIADFKLGLNGEYYALIGEFY